MLSPPIYVGGRAVPLLLVYTIPYGAPYVNTFFKIFYFLLPCLFRWGFSVYRASSVVSAATVRHGSRVQSVLIGDAQAPIYCAGFRFPALLLACTGLCSLRCLSVLLCVGFGAVSLAVII